MAKDPVGIPTRKGARRLADVTPEVLARLNKGLEPTITLAEILSVDFKTLLRNVAPDLPRSKTESVVGGIVPRMNAAGTALFDHYGPTASKKFANHPSDIVRGWAAYAAAADPKPSLDRRIKAFRIFADDPHSGTREWAWMALRPHLAAELELAIELLTPWTKEKSPNLRRFASEATRPRGVWCSHIAALRENPALGISILEPLRADPHKYVQDSVSNWLNDASKHKPAWVRALCARWQRESKTKATERICRRSLRTLQKAPK